MPRRNWGQREAGPIRVIDPVTGEVKRTVDKYRGRPTGQEQSGADTSAQLAALKDVQSNRLQGDEGRSALASRLSSSTGTGVVTDSDLQRGPELFGEQNDIQQKINDLLKKHDQLNQKEFLRFSNGEKDLSELELALQHKERIDQETENNLKYFKERYGKTPTREEYEEVFMQEEDEEY
jgi:hypothetical protein